MSRPKSPGVIINYELVEQYARDNDITNSQMSIDIFGGRSMLSQIKCRGGHCGMDTAQRIADYMGVSLEELMDTSRVETGTGKVLYREPVPVPEREPAEQEANTEKEDVMLFESGLIADFLKQCCDRVTRGKTEYEAVYRTYQWYCGLLHVLPRTRDAVLTSLKGRGVKAYSEYGRTYLLNCKPYNGIVNRAAQLEQNEKGENPVEEVKKPSADGMKALAAWAAEKYTDGADQVDVLELMRKIRELRGGA